MTIRRIEAICKLIKLVFVLPFAFAGYLAVWSQTEGVVRIFMLSALFPFLIAVAGDEWIGLMRALAKPKSSTAK